MIATLLVGLSLTVGQGDAPKLGAPIPAATGSAQLLAPVADQEKSKVKGVPTLLPPAAPAPDGNRNKNGNGASLGFLRTFWKADADLQQPVLFGAER